MRKTLQDVACYLKETLVPESNEAYALNPVYAEVFPDDNIWEGVLALREFLCRLYDALAVQGGKYDTSKKIIHEYENRTGLSVYYPFLHNLNIILRNIGYLGALDKVTQTLICDNTIFNEKISVSQNMECLRFLTDCGLCFAGVDVNNKKQKLSDITSIHVTYSDNPAMLIGLKVMAIAETEHSTLVNQDVFFRCDYRALKKDETDIVDIVQDTIKPLSTEIKDFILRLHHRYLDKGIACSVEIKGFHTYIKYCYKRKDVWGLNVSLNNGYHINFKPIKTDEYADTIKTFPPFLQELIAKGYGCGRKREIGHCDGGCRGLPIALDDSVLDMQDDIFTWLDQELFYLKNK